MKIQWTKAARDNLVDISDYIALRSPASASRFISEILERTSILLTAPLAFRMVPELAQNDIREIIFGNYRIVYRITDGAIHILTVFEGHKLLDMDVNNDSSQN